MNIVTSFGALELMGIIEKGVRIHVRHENDIWQDIYFESKRVGSAPGLFEIVKLYVNFGRVELINDKDGVAIFKLKNKSNLYPYCDTAKGQYEYKSILKWANFYDSKFN